MMMKNRAPIVPAHPLRVCVLGTGTWEQPRTRMGTARNRWEQARNTKCREQVWEQVEMHAERRSLCSSVWPLVLWVGFSTQVRAQRERKPYCDNGALLLRKQRFYGLGVVRRLERC